jgi:hypothetical protein
MQGKDTTKYGKNKIIGIIFLNKRPLGEDKKESKGTSQLPYPLKLNLNNEKI